jgi:hypothetical protein
MNTLKQEARGLNNGLFQSERVFIHFFRASHLDSDL